MNATMLRVVRPSRGDKFFRARKTNARDERATRNQPRTISTNENL